MQGGREVMEEGNNNKLNMIITADKHAVRIIIYVLRIHNTDNILELHSICVTFGLL